MADKTFIDKIGAIPRSYIYVLIIILIIIPLLKPIGLPASTDPYTLDVFHTISSLPPDSKVLVNIQISASGYLSFGPWLVVLSKQLFEMPVKVIYCSFAAANPGVIDLMASEVDYTKKEYGVDWIVLDWVPGGETGKAAFAKDIRSVVSTDWKYDKPLGEYPIMDDINKITDFDIIVVSCSGTAGVLECIRQWVTPYGMPFYTNAPPQDVPRYYAFIAAGQVTGMINGNIGIAYYERLFGSLGGASKMLDVQSLVMLTVLILMLIGNVSYFASKGRKK